jgi:hypothetical protein
MRTARRWKARRPPPAGSQAVRRRRPAHDSWSTPNDLS